MEQRSIAERVRICAVSYLNSVPLVWGLLRDRHLDAQPFDLTFRVPAGTAEMLKNSEADVGIVSSIELPRQNLDYVKGLGIASRGAVRSIFLIASKPIGGIRSLAADSHSRTSVALCRIVLARRYGIKPEIINMPPDLPAMLHAADAALIIGDPALHLEPSRLPYEVYDVGEEWAHLTGLPMVYAVWAARHGALTASLIDVLFESYYFGRDHLEEIIKSESARRGFAEDLARRYLTRHLAFELEPDDLRGLELYLQYAAELDLI